MQGSKRKERYTVVYVALLLLIVVLTVGVTGYIIIEDFSLLEALYMTYQRMGGSSLSS